MSRIQEILKKAERDGGVHRTRAFGTDSPLSGGPALGGGGLGPAGALAATMPVAAPAADTASFEPPVWTRPDVDVVDVQDSAPSRTAGALDARLVAALAPQSLAAEQFRLLRTRITQSENGRAFRSLIVTSPAKGDGKSLTAANLALTMALELHQRVLLVDADLRRPSVHDLFGLSETPGLTGVLMGGATLDEALVPVPDQRLTVLPAGSIPSRPAELLASSAMRRTLDTLRSQFDRVILDMPPVEPLADVSITAALVDGVLLIVRAGVTPKPAIERALSGLEPGKVVGLVFNDTGRGESGYGGYGYIGG
ncbi:MAG TPA: CpsD/CapB family tyrosine-protein kinase [Vicinamibacterales bacterium]|jgi:capsular exopolysaccharide synthesis family protein